MPYRIFPNLVARCQEDGTPQHVLDKNTVVMHQADGTISISIRGCTILRIQCADKPDLFDYFKVLIQKLWSEQYYSLADSAQQSLKALGTVELCHASCAAATIDSDEVKFQSDESAMLEVHPD